MSEKYSSAAAIREGQLASLNELLRTILPANRFYARKAREADAPCSFNALEEYSRIFPFTRKAEIAQDQQEHPLYGENLTFPLEAYSRLHQTSGTTGKPLRWLDTPESWDVLIRCWMEVYHAAGITRKDVAFFAFSFGPFLGFWLAFEAAGRLGCLCLPGGALTSRGRLQLLLDSRSTVLCCTPTYAIHLAEVAAQDGIDLRKGAVRTIVVAGEAGGSVPATRAHIERLWPGARVFDHHGMTEVGPVTYECPSHPCRLHVCDWAYYAEVIDPETGAPVPVGANGELVLTTLKRTGSPLLRYRTGDLVRLAAHHGKGEPCECGRWETALEGGIIGRTDDMVVVRGVNLFPSAVEQVVRQIAEVTEYQVNISSRGAMTEVRLVVELAPGVPEEKVVEQLENALQTAFSLRIPVAVAEANSLPRSELKARRWIRLPA